MTTAPEPYYADGPVTIWHGDCLDVMRQLPDASVDAIVTDPPYGLEFMGKDWDSFKTGRSAEYAKGGTLGTFGFEGGASRFFKTVTPDPPFRYAAKAGTAERPRVAADDPDEGDVAHPTVKPLDLMRYLVRLVTPAGGTVLEPFAGSGTTAEAAVLEGARCIAIEREADYLPLILRRIRKPHAVGLDLGDWDQAPTPVPTRLRPAGGRTAPRSGIPAPPVGLDFGDDWELLDA